MGEIQGLNFANKILHVGSIVIIIHVKTDKKKKKTIIKHKTDRVTTLNIIFRVINV